MGVGECRYILVFFGITIAQEHVFLLPSCVEDFKKIETKTKAGKGEGGGGW